MHFMRAITQSQWRELYAVIVFFCNLCGYLNPMLGVSSATSFNLHCL